MQNLNWVDYIFLAIFFVTILGGLSRGLVKEVISLASWVAAIVVASMFANTLALKFTGSEGVQAVVNQTTSATGLSTAQTASYAAVGVSFLVLFVGTLIVGAIVGSIINLAFQVGLLGIGNRLFGGIFGLFKGAVINLVLIFLVQMTAFAAQEAWQQSQIVVAYQPAVVWLNNLVSPTLANIKVKVGETIEEVNSSIQKMTQ